MRLSTISFIICLQKLKEHCVYKVEGDNQVRYRASSSIKDRNLKAKLYREETLSLTKVLEIVSQYREKEALILDQRAKKTIFVRIKDKEESAGDGGQSRPF